MRSKRAPRKTMPSSNFTGWASGVKYLTPELVRILFDNAMRRVYHYKMSRDLSAFDH